MSISYTIARWFYFLGQIQSGAALAGFTVMVV